MTDTTFNPAEMFETVKHVTLPQLKLEAGTPVFVRITSEIREADPVAPSRNRDSKDGETKTTMAPPKLVNVDNLAQSNKPYQMIVNEVVGRELEKTYPDHSYVNRCFKITLLNIQGKRYKGAEVIEIRPKAEPNNAPADNGHAGKGKK